MIRNLILPKVPHHLVLQNADLVAENFGTSRPNESSGIPFERDLFHSRGGRGGRNVSVSVGSLKPDRPEEVLEIIDSAITNDSDEICRNVGVDG